MAEDSAVLRDAIADLIRDDPRLSLVGLAADAHEAVDMARVYQPEVAVLDVKMPGGGGKYAAAEISAISPETRILAFSAYEDRQSVTEMLDAGAFGYLIKGARMDEIIREILRAAGVSDADS